MSVAGQNILFITGRLAAPSLKQLLDPLGNSLRFQYDVCVLGISVAALMQTEWVCRKLKEICSAGTTREIDTTFEQYDRVILPGWCLGDLTALERQFALPFERGPKDLADLPHYLGHADKPEPDLSQYDIEILAEINHAPRLTDAEIVQQADAYRSSGADIIDLGCVPGESWSRAGAVTALLKQHGHRVSIDSFDRTEVETSVEHGAELVLSCNNRNLDWAARLDVDWVVIPDDPQDLTSLHRTIAVLESHNRSYRVDPILEPIGFGFAQSLGRYHQVRQQYPAVKMMMGVGNLTELTDVDTAGVNVLLAAFCQELGIHSVLTTEVINWARSAVQEFDLARRLVYYSLHHHQLPKHVDSQLIILRDTDAGGMGEQQLLQMATRLTDPNFRIFAEQGELHVMNRDGYWKGTDPFVLFDQILQDTATELDAGHSFYLGYEICKAVTALTLGKRYTQDQALNWGFLTVPEIRALHSRKQETTTEHDQQQ